jgi:hypothetical protein
MNLKEIKKNLDAVAQVFAKTKNVDTNSILLLSMAQTLVLLLEEKINKDGKDELQQLSEEE